MINIQDQKPSIKELVILKNERETVIGYRWGEGRSDYYNCGHVGEDGKNEYGVFVPKEWEAMK